MASGRKPVIVRKFSRDWTAGYARPNFGQDAPELLFTENETNAERLWGVPNRTPYVKDGINAAVTGGDQADATNPACVGTKVAARG